MENNYTLLFSKPNSRDSTEILPQNTKLLYVEWLKNFHLSSWVQFLKLAKFIKLTICSDSWHPTPVFSPGKIPWMEEPGRLQSMGSRRVRHGHDSATSLSLFTFMHWRRKWQPTPVFLPGESQGWGSLVGCVYEVAQSRTWLKRLSSSSSSDSLKKCYPCFSSPRNLFLGKKHGHAQS